MGLFNNFPSFSYVGADGISVTWNDEVYMVQSFNTNKKYIYWSATNPYQLNASNVMPNRSSMQYLVIVNDNGMAIEVPSTTDDFSINYDGNNVQAVRDRIFGLYEKNENDENRFILIEQDLEGIKQIVGEGGSGEGGIWDKISQIEQRVDSIKLSVEKVETSYNEDKEMNQLREDLNSSIINLNADLGIFKSETTDYFKDNKISDEEKISIDVHKVAISLSLESVMIYVDKVILIAESKDLTQETTALNSGKTALRQAHDNLINILTTAISDGVITPSEITVVTDCFAKYNLKINELKNTCDGVVFLGIGGVISEELARIDIKSDSIVLSVQKVETNYKSDMSLQKLELEGQIKDVNNALSSFEDVVNTTFKDGIVTEAEKSLLNEKIAVLDKEKIDIDSQYNSIKDNVNLSASAKKDLDSKYTNYINKHNELKNKIQQVISDDFVNDSEKAEVDVLFKQYANVLAGFSASMNKAIEDVAINLANEEIKNAKENLQGQIDEVKGSIDNIGDIVDGTFENNILDEMERQTIKANLETLEREKIDIDKQYIEMYNNQFLLGKDKVDLQTSYTNYLAKYNDLVNVINQILEKTDLIDDVDRANMNSAIARHNEYLGLFFTQANKSIDIIATNKTNAIKEELGNQLSDLQGKVDGLDEFVNGTFENNILDEVERQTIAQNMENLEREKIDIDNTYEQIYANILLDGQLKVDFKTSYDGFVTAYNNVKNVIQGILDKTEYIDNTDRENLSNALLLLNERLANFVTNANKSIDYISTKKADQVKGELQKEISDVDARIDGILDDVGGALADGIIDEAEALIIADNLNRLQKEKLDVDAKYSIIYNNVNLIGTAKTNLKTAKDDFDAKIKAVIDTINNIIQDGKATEAEKASFNTAISNYNSSSATLSKRFDEAVDSINKKVVNDASSSLQKEINDVNNALGDLEGTMNGAFQDGILSEAEKRAIEQNLKTLASSKSNIDKQYTSVYANANLVGAYKTELKTAYDNYVSGYNSLVTVINTVLNKVGLVDSTDRTNLNNAFNTHNTRLGEYSTKVNSAIDSINKKGVEDAKNNLQGQINDVSGALGDLESTMNGAFQDGILTEAEKLSIKQSLNTLASEKSDVDKQYLTVYANADLVGTAKTNLKTAYDNYITAYNSLVKVINDILNKSGLINSTDRTNLNNAFNTHNTRLGEYSVRVNEAVDAIAQKKAEAESEKVDKKYAEIILDPETGIQFVVGEVKEEVRVTQTELNKVPSMITDSASNTLKDAKDSMNKALEDYVTDSEYTTYKESVSTQFQQTSESFNFSFNNFTSEINKTVDGIKETTDETKKYINFENGDIIIGSNKSTLVLKIKNDRIQFLDSGVEVAYVSNNKLYITDSQVTNSLQVGKYIWQPRSNGNLSFVWKG